MTPCIAGFKGPLCGGDGRVWERREKRGKRKRMEEMRGERKFYATCKNS